MPTYEYRCETCDERIEVFAAMSDPPPAACDACGATTLVKVLFPVAVHYKGSGFYSTDYANKKSSAPSSSTSSESSSSDSSSSNDSASKPAESKAASASSDSGTASSSKS